jgi:hypothetical protein
MKGGSLAGVHEFLSGDEWEWFLPARPGDRYTKRFYLYSVDEKARSSFSGGRSVITRYRMDYMNRAGELAAIQRLLFVRAEREAATKTKKEAHIEPAHYSDEEVAAIDAAYAAQPPPRHADRYWEDVAEGEQLPLLPKGPLRTSDIIAWHAGYGSSLKAYAMAYKDRMHRPGFYNKNQAGWYDVVQRVHWDSAWAQQVGGANAYDYGRMRTCFLSQVITDWMGDNAWLWKLRSEFRRFNYHGDMTWATGRVTGKRVDDDGRHIAELDMWCRNQREEVTASGRAQVILPSREHGEALLPTPSAETEGTVPLIY